MVSPVIKYPFFFLYFFFIIYVLYVYKAHIISKIKELLVNYWVFWILFLFLLIAFFFSDKIYISILKDLINVVVLLSLYLVLSIIIQGKKELADFIKGFSSIMVVFGILISILGLLDLFNIFSYNKYFLSNDVGSNKVDYNFTLLPVFYALIIVLYALVTKTFSTRKKVFLNLLLVIFSLQIFFSGSKRGSILLIVIILILLSAKVLVFFNWSLYLKKALSNLSFYLFSLTFISLCFYLFISYASFVYKNRFLEKMGSKDILSTKITMSNNLFRWFPLIDRNNNYIDFYKKFWSVVYDPREPDKGWSGLNIHQTIFPLSGDKVEIVPKGSRGMLMDSTFRGKTWDGDTYSITLIGWNQAEIGDSVKASIYCYVSKEFDGSSVELVLLFGKSKEIHGEYDLNKKGIWQKLETSDIGAGEEVKASFYFSKKGVIDFSSLKGQVIIAFPQFMITKTNGTKVNFYNSVSVNSVNPVLKNIKSQSCSKIHYFIEGEEHVSSDYVKSTLGIPFNLASIIQANKKDPLRKWINNFVVEDTSYHPFHSNIVLKKTSYISIDERLMRWQFALEIFAKEFKLSQKVFGGGFNFLNWYSYYFYNDKTRSDYPHNPFLSVLLYSGIIGLIFYLIVMYKVFFYYVKYFREYKLISIFFLITFFFSFFSAGSPFDPPVMGFFFILPFFLHHVNNLDTKPIGSENEH